MSKHIRIILRLMAITFTLVTAASCGPPAPVYRTTYHYTPPDTPEGQVCVSQCEVGRSQCEQLARMRHDQCTERAQADFDNCEANADDEYESCLDEREYDSSVICIRQTCFMNDDCGSETGDCESQYNRCFEVCGGGVEEDTQCMAHCG